MSITGSSGTRAIANRYPAEEGITAETTKQRSTPRQLVPTKGSLVSSRRKTGIGD